MRENCDYVTMDTYTADMREATDRAVAIEHWKRKALQAERALVAVVLGAGGKANFPFDYLLDHVPCDVTITRNEPDRSYTVKAKRP